MRREIRRVVPLKTANIVALVYALVFLVMAILFILPIATLMPVQGPAGDPNPRSRMLVMAALYPFLGGIVGWLGTLLMSYFYNLLAPRVGGIQMEVEDPAPGSGTGHAA